MYCKHCGNELGEKDVFCTQCGNRIVEKTKQVRKKRKKKRKFLLVSVVGVFLALLIAVSVWTIRWQNSEDYILNVEYKNIVRELRNSYDFIDGLVFDGAIITIKNGVSYVELRYVYELNNDMPHYFAGIYEEEMWTKTQYGDDAETQQRNENLLASVESQIYSSEDLVAVYDEDFEIVEIINQE